MDDMNLSEADLNNKNSQDIGMEFGIETKSKRKTTVRRELPNQKRKRTRGEKENYNYSGILEAGTIKKAEMKKEEEEKSISEEQENFLKPCTSAENSSKR